MAENELGAFLRARREAVQPADVGLPHGTRRRAPGLRRAELAMLADLSVEYLTRLEQGRDRNPSLQVLAGLANALQLSTGDRELLMRAAKASAGGACPGDLPAPASSVRASVRAMLERLEPTPAVVINRLTDVLASTSGYARLVGPIGLLDPAAPNLARFVFTDERAPAAFRDWDDVADEVVSSMAFDARSDDEHMAAFRGELEVLAGDNFISRHAASPSAPRRHGTLRFAHPVVGELRLSFEALELPDDDGQRMLIYLPADEPSSVALDQLTGRVPGELRAVG